MTDKVPRLRRAVLQSSKDPRRSPLFHWLRKHQRLLLATQTGGCRHWAPLLAKAIEAGVTDDRGAQPTERVMRDTWRKIRAEVLTQPDTQDGSLKEPRKRQPRDLPMDWRPTPLATGAPSSALVVPTATTDAAGEARKMSGAEARLSLRQVLAERSGRIE